MSTGGKISALVGAGVIAFFAYGFYIQSTPEGQARNRERDVIDNCRTAEARSPGPYTHALCLQLEADFRRKWNREP